jgi:hypothetical protein
MTLSRLIVEGIFTPVPVLSTPGLSGFSLPTYKWCRMMTTGWYFSHFIRVPVLELPSGPYNEVVIPPSMDNLREFFHTVPQGKERTTTIRIGALSASHRMLAKIVQHNLWPTVRRSDLI